MKIFGMEIQTFYPLILGLATHCVADFNDKIRDNLSRQMRSVGSDPPGRGSFHLDGSLDWTNLKKQGSSVSDLPEIYLCKKRKRGDGEEACCIGKNTECFTNGGCFCDESCQQYDDCCPDYNDTCSNLLDLCLTTEATPTGAPKAHKKVEGGGRGEEAAPNVRHHGVRPVRVEPNSCCGPDPYNDGESCCCEGKIVEIPCSETPCA